MEGEGFQGLVSSEVFAAFSCSRYRWVQSDKNDNRFTTDLQPIL